VDEGSFLCGLIAGTYDKKEYKVSGRNKVSKRKRRYLWEQRSVQYVMEK